ncbi:MAG: Rpn family recombination-promoting nuclease/putative transposase [Spirochaetota bacterium]
MSLSYKHFRLKAFWIDNARTTTATQRCCFQDHFGVEMQTYPQNYYAIRVLYYWSKIYTKQISRGEEFYKLKPVYSVSFLNFKLLQEPGYHFNFHVLEKDRPQITLTNYFEIHIVELTEFLKTIPELASELECWIYLIREAGNMQEAEFKALKERNPVIEEAVEALQDISLDQKTRDYYEMRIKSERDFEAMKDYAYDKGIEQGIQKARKRAEKLQQVRDRKKSLRVAIKLKKSSHSLDSIAEIVELPLSYLQRFFQKIGI